MCVEGGEVLERSGLDEESYFRGVVGGR